MAYQKTVLENGITIVTEKMASVRSVSLGLWVRCGARDEMAGEEGMSHFMEHMLFKGTPTRNAIQISSAFDSIGAVLNAFTSHEVTCFYASMIDKHFATGFEILADMLVNPLFKQEDIDLEQGVVVEEIARSQDDPDDVVGDIFQSAMYPQNNLGKPVLGKKETVESFDSAKMHEYHQKHYTSENIVVAAAGNIDHDLVVELTQKLLANAPSGEMLQRPDFVKQNRKDLAIKNKDTEQAHLLVGFPGLGYFDDTKFACRMMSAALGGSMSSRLFVEIREKRGLAYAIACSNQEFVDCGTFYIMAGTRPENVEEVLETTFSELKKLVSGGVTQEELDRSRELICGNTVLAFESTSAHMRRIGNHAVRNANLITIDDLLERYKSISLEECNDIAKSIFEQTPTIAMVSPIKDDDANTRLLKFV